MAADIIDMSVADTSGATVNAYRCIDVVANCIDIISGTDEDTRALIIWRAANASLFTGRRNATVCGYEMFISARGLEGRVKPVCVKKKWENLKQKYKDLKCPKNGVTKEGGETSAASWKWYSLMDEVVRGWSSEKGPFVLIASSSQDIPMVSPPSVVSPEQTTTSSSSSKKRRVDVVDALMELQKMEGRFLEREDVRYREEAERDERRHREALEREERRYREAVGREERRHREAVEKEERRHREAVEREQQLVREMSAREERLVREMREREERRDRETAAREERFLSILSHLLQK